MPLWCLRLIEVKFLKYQFAMDRFSKHSKIPLLLLAFGLICFILPAQQTFDAVFYHRTMRIDYVQAGNSETAWYALDQIMAEPGWAGSQTRLIDTLQYGQYFFEVYDHETRNMLYSRGYGSLFGEWQTTQEAGERHRSFNETIRFPYPKNKVDVLFYSRNFQGLFDSVFSLTIDPDCHHIKPSTKQVWPVFEVEINAVPQHAVDIVLLPDGYTQEELGEFINHSREFAESLFTFEPYRSHRESFNIRAVLAPSTQSGAAIPADSIWPATLLSSSFYTFDSERYIMSMDHKSIRDMAAHAPYDQIFILVNTDTYGGGGIFNFYSLSTTGHRLSAKVIVHEFGHGFAGLGDEYFDSSTAYENFYNLDIEPWEPNLTTLTDFSKKWGHLMVDSVPVPTPDSSRYDHTTGVFEGGGYVPKGMYRPARHCLMQTLAGESFCAVCQDAITRMIRFHTD